MRRCLFSILGISFCALACCQVLPEEKKALSDTLFLNNLTLNDLNFFRRPVKELYPNDVVHLCVDQPLNGLAEMMRVHEKAYQAMPSDLIRLARMDLLGDDTEYRSPLAATTPEALPATVPAQLTPVVEFYAKAVADANAYVHAALKGLTPDEKRQLIDSLPQWAAGDEPLNLNFTKRSPVGQEQVLALLQKVNLPLLRRAAEALAAKAETEMPQLIQASRALAWNGEAKFKYLGIDVDISGLGDHPHSGKAAQLVIDFGGHNHYRGREGAGVLGAALLIDCGGGDTFEQSDLGAGCGFLGVGLAYILGGGNTFTEGSMALGSGVAGVGVLTVEGSSNLYRSKNLSQGFGIFGLGALISTGGNNKFEAVAWSQAAARTQGVGWVVNRDGNNLYQMKGYGDDAHTFGQSYAAGFENDSAWVGGGIALISEGRGNNTFLATNNCQASANNFSLASIYQPTGDHDFIAGREAQGYASKQSAAQMITLDGNGSFVLKESDGQAFSVGDSVAVVLNRKGDNNFISGGLGPAEAVNQGLALFVHDSGKDHISGTPGVGINTGSGDSLGLLVDMDASQSMGESSIATVRPGMGLALQVEGSKHAVMGQSVSRVFPTPGSKPLPANNVLEDLYASATNPESFERDRQGAQDQWISFGMPGLNWLLDNKLKSATAAGCILIGLDAKLCGTSGKEALGLKITDQNDQMALNALRIGMMENFQEIGPLVLGALSRPALQLDAVRAVGQFKLKDTGSTLMVLAGQKDMELELASLNSMTILAEPGALTTGQALLGSSDLLIREAAMNLVAVLPGGMDVAKALLKDPDEQTARTGVQLLGKIGTPDALALVGGALSNMKSGVRIQALLALNGRIPDKFKSKVDSLKDDPSALVRAVVAGLAR
ncbi:MAG TPA: HEAT repeat domain-containing protein [Fimbriimonadaceae bacterium]